MKIGMEKLSPYQVASLRILSAGLVLIPFAWNAWKQIPKKKMPFVVMSGLLGSFFPAFLYCVAETKIDSALAAILNALTPVFAIIIGVSFFNLKITKQKIAGVIIGFIGLLLLPFAANKAISLTDVSYSGLVLIATIFYGINVNMVSRYLHEIGSLNIASVAFSLLIIPCIILLILNGYFSIDFSEAGSIKSTSASVILGVFGTAIAFVLFYILVKKAGAIFASLVTYGIPFIAIVWGFIFGEIITPLQFGCLGIILAGVYLVNKNSAAEQG